MKIKRLIATFAIALLLLGTLSMPVLAADSADVPASVTVTSVISITISGAAAGGISFGSLIPGSTSNLETHSNNVTPSIVVTVDAGTTVHVNLQMKGTDFISSNFTIANAKYSLTYSGTKTAMTTGYTTFATDVAPSGAATVWHWLDVPSSGVSAGTYGSTFSYKAIPN